MAKRARGSTTRPGQRPPLQRTSSDATDDRADADGRRTSDPDRRGGGPRRRRSRPRSSPRRRPPRRSRDATRDRARRAADEPIARGGTISVRAAEEYGYVMRDVRRIVTIGGGLVVALIGFWAIVQATGIGPF